MRGFINRCLSRMKMYRLQEASFLSDEDKPIYKGRLRSLAVDSCRSERYVSRILRGGTGDILDQQSQAASIVAFVAAR